jgi:hypothetical protein
VELLINKTRFITNLQRISKLRRALWRWYRNFLASVTRVNEKYEMREQDGPELDRVDERSDQS